MPDATHEIGKLVPLAVSNILEMQRAGTLTENKLSFMLGVLTSETRRLVLEETPVKCAECAEPLSRKVQARCPKHIAMMLAGDAAKAKAREHGPVLLTKAAMGLQGLFDKYLGDEPEPPAPPSPPTTPEPGASDFRAPPSS